VVETEIEIGRAPRPIPIATGTFVLADAEAMASHRDLVGTAPAPLVLEGGEGSKTMAALEQVLRCLAAARILRDGALLAIGGGAILDLGGLAASLWLRGIALELVPTTLLAMCDASVGGKTAIDLPEGKNLVGTFWPARRVWIDATLVATQSEGQFRSGLGELLKVAIGLDAGLFSMLERQREPVLARDPAVVQEAIRRAIAAKLAIVREDPRESGRRRLLNLGHTLGHALEAHSGFALSHGLAVARGLHASLDEAERRGSLPAEDLRRCRALLLAYGFEPWPLPPAQELAPFLAVDKKRTSAGAREVLITGIGSSVVV
jgi:3-dehydroquinate synthase